MGIVVMFVNANVAVEAGALSAIFMPRLEFGKPEKGISLNGTPA